MSDNAKQKERAVGREEGRHFFKNGKVNLFFMEKLMSMNKSRVPSSPSSEGIVKRHGRVDETDSTSERALA